jgi:hypothetical protein
MVKPTTCCGKADACVCAQQATCSCGKQSALACTCEKATTENTVAGARCSCRAFFLHSHNHFYLTNKPPQALELPANVPASVPQPRTRSQRAMPVPAGCDLPGPAHARRRPMEGCCLQRRISQQRHRMLLLQRNQHRMRILRRSRQQIGMHTITWRM